jgi:antirestriction protein ArdC
VAHRRPRIETVESGEEALREIAFMKGYTVFNCEQIEGLPTHYLCDRDATGFHRRTHRRRRRFRRQYRGDATARR